MQTIAGRKPNRAFQAAREAKGWTQSFLSVEFGVSRTIISDIERYGRVPGPQLRAKLAAALDVPEWELWPQKPDEVTE